MKRRGVLVGALVMGAAVFALRGCWSSRAHVKLHVEVMTPQGLKSGSTVLEMVSNTIIVWDVEHTAGISHGQAAVVDLPGGPVFALLRTVHGADSSQLGGAIMDGLAPVAPGEDASKAMKGQIEKIADAAPGELRFDLPPESWPLMVRFRDINDPKSVEQVDPAAIGVKRIWVETTSDPVSTGIEKRLPSYGPSSGFDAWYGGLAMDDPRRFTLDDFRKGN